MDTGRPFPHTANVAAVCAEEFINNIIRHGHATSIDLSANVGNDTVRASDSKIGLGLTLASAFCQNIDYKYLFNQNMVVLTIQK